MYTLKFMQLAVDYFNRYIFKSSKGWTQALIGLQSTYKDLQHTQTLTRPVIEAAALVKNEEFLRYVAVKLNDVCDPMEFDNKRFAASMMFIALHDYEHKTGKGLSGDGLSSLQRIALCRYVGDIMKGDNCIAVEGAMHALGEYLLGIDSTVESNLEALKLIDAMRLAILRWMPPHYNLIDLTLKVDD